ncbi:hypothetical protein BN159_1172 [Streptomyces davaonensis JCM 4913]|uniref:Zinc-finger domain-containing protein n=1 Tax=Streptomyces davaonensis (strain DSM 101723 / JCM 4913 / KCC S-0913 / 768) TaxID=1214101 RepID=K4QT03_STRDJ|nr:hypothetical protein [Streptomyces davaonensis]CCK25551.1 hypothetical protein BN159_1172 [Streptomyces davaonensis JCM 4913]
MTDRDCASLRAVADELALGALHGQERADAIAHLDRCPACREHVEQLSLVADGLLSLLPGSEPPSGFETRVLDRLRLNRPTPRRRPRTGVAVAAAAVIALGFGFGGWAVGTAVDGEPTPPSQSAEPPGSEQGLLSASLLTPDHRPVGRIFAYTDSPGWVYMSVHLGDESEAAGSYGGYPDARKVSCRLERTDGTAVHIGDFSLDNAGRGYWGAPARVDSDTLSGAQLLDADGSVLATAHFDARQSR